MCLFDRDALEGVRLSVLRPCWIEYIVQKLRAVQPTDTPNPNGGVNHLFVGHVSVGAHEHTCTRPITKHERARAFTRPDLPFERYEHTITSALTRIWWFVISVDWMSAIVTTFPRRRPCLLACAAAALRSSKHSASASLNFIGGCQCWCSQ